MSNHFRKKIIEFDKINEPCIVLTSPFNNLRGGNLNSRRFETKTIREGRTLLMVPGDEEPRKIPAFFNPRGSLARDISISCYKSYAKIWHKKQLSFADALSGVGARAIRVANEVRESHRVFVNDLNPTALRLARKSARLNRVVTKCVFSMLDAGSFLVARGPSDGERFDIVDIDPFGTPTDYVDAGIKSVSDGGLLSISATDSAVLCGVYPLVAQRKYLGLPLRTDYCHEVGLRLLFGLLAMTAMRFEVGIDPIFCHHDMHYFRIYAEIKVGNKYAAESDSEIGFVAHCFKCGHRTTYRRSDTFNGSRAIERDISCPECGRSSSMKLAGPLWVGKIQSKDFVKECFEESKISVFQTEELDIPLYYDLTTISDKLGTRTPKLLDVIKNIQGSGHRASRTHLNPNALKTDAPEALLLSVVKELAR